MKKISILSALFILSVVTLYRSHGSYKEYYLIKTGNKLSKAGSYTEADALYRKAIEKFGSKEGIKNRAINFYADKEYEGVVENTNEEMFIKGNSFVYIAEKEEGNKRVEYHEKALEEYIKAMKLSEDINIKKNYEIISEKLKKNREEQEEKQQQDREKNEEGKGRENSKEQRNDQNKKQDKSEGDIDNSKEGRSEEKEGQQPKMQQKNGEKQDIERDSGKRDTQITSREESDEESEGGTQKKEAYTILQRLEGDEDQAFKNNERLKNIGGDRDEVSW